MLFPVAVTFTAPVQTTTSQLGPGGVAVFVGTLVGELVAVATTVNVRVAVRVNVRVGVRVAVGGWVVGVRVAVLVGVRVEVLVFAGVEVGPPPLPKSVASAIILVFTDTPYGLLGVKLVLVPERRQGQPSLSKIQEVQLMWRVPLFMSIISLSVSDWSIWPPVPNSVTRTG
jgi:hypothetical protein